HQHRLSQSEPAFYAVSLAYLLPGGRREAAIRFAVGVVCGLGFGGTAGVKIAVELGIESWLGLAETMLMGSAAASLCAWWGLGLLLRSFERYGAMRWRKPGPADGRTTDEG